MEIPILIVGLFVAALVLLGALAAWLWGARGPADGAAHPELADAVAILRTERAEYLNAALDASLSVASSKLGDQLAVGKHVIDRERLAVADQVQNMSAELARVGQMVTSLQKERAEQSGKLTADLAAAATVTADLAQTTSALKEALASPKARGQWGERMAEDVLRTAGFVEGVNYARATKLTDGGVPDYSFPLPQGRALHMDVKFPASAYLRWLEEPSEAEATLHLKQFKADVRQRVNELVKRGYSSGSDSVDYVLVFIPNESIFGFLHEHDPELVDYALERRIVLTSPTSLFAVLAIVRAAVDNFLIEQKGDELVASLGSLANQWERMEGSIDKMGRGLAAAQSAFDDLNGPRRRAMGRSLDVMDEFRGSERALGDGTGEPQLDLSASTVRVEPAVGRDNSTT